MNKDITELLKTYDDLEEQYKLLMKQNKKLDNELKHKTKQYEFLRHRDNIAYYENRINKTIYYVEELYEIAKEQDSDNVNLIDRLELILNILKGED